MTSGTTPGQDLTVHRSTQELEPVMAPAPHASSATPSVRSASAVGETSAWYVEKATQRLRSLVPLVSPEPTARPTVKQAHQPMRSVSRPWLRTPQQVLLMILRLLPQEVDVTDDSDSSMTDRKEKKVQTGPQPVVQEPRGWRSKCVGALREQ